MLIAAVGPLFSAWIWQSDVRFKTLISITIHWDCDPSFSTLFKAPMAMACSHHSKLGLVSLVLQKKSCLMTVLCFSPSFCSEQEMKGRLSLVKLWSYNWVSFDNACNIAMFVTSVVSLQNTANGQFCDITGRNISNQFPFYGKRRVMNKNKHQKEENPKSCVKILNSS